MKPISVTFIANSCTAPPRAVAGRSRSDPPAAPAPGCQHNYSWLSTNAKYKREATSCTDNDLGPGLGASGEARAAGWEQRRWPKNKPVEEHEANVRTWVQHKPIWASRTVTWCAPRKEFASNQDEGEHMFHVAGSSVLLVLKVRLISYVLSSCRYSAEYNALKTSQLS
jgi:hypothetical protein